MKQLLFLLFLAPLFVFAQEKEVALPQDSMTFVNETLNKEAVIFSGDRIRLFKTSGMKINGDFISISAKVFE